MSRSDNDFIEDNDHLNYTGDVELGQTNEPIRRRKPQTKCADETTGPAAQPQHTVGLSVVPATLAEPDPKERAHGRGAHAAEKAVA